MLYAGAARTKSLTGQPMEAMITSKVKTAFLALFYFSAPITWLAVPGAQAQARADAINPAEDQRWLASASGRVEPWSGVIKVGVLAPGIIDEVLVLSLIHISEPTRPY